MRRSEEDLRNAILWPIGLSKIASTTLQSTKSLTTLSMPRDTLPLVMPRTLSPSLKMDLLPSKISNSLVTRLNGSTTPQRERDVSSDLPMPMDRRRLSVEFTLTVPRKLGTVTCGKEALSRISNPLTPLWRSPSPEKRPSLPSTLHGASSAKEWKRNFRNLPKDLILMCTSSVETKNVNSFQLT